MKARHLQISSAFSSDFICQITGCDILYNSSRENRRLYRDHIVGSSVFQEPFKTFKEPFKVSLILATDMATHFEFLGKFRVRVAGSEFNLQDAKCFKMLQRSLKNL